MQVAATIYTFAYSFSHLLELTPRVHWNSQITSTSHILVPSYTISKITAVISIFVYLIKF